EPRAARDGADRRGARKIAGQQRARACRADAQALRCRVVRLFFALWPPAATVAALAAWAVQVQKAAGGRVTRPESIHLTLAFLGEIADDRVGDAVKAAVSVRGERHTLPIERAKVWAHN